MTKFLQKLRFLPTDQLQMDSSQPRTDYGVEGAHNQLSESLKEWGVQVPLVVMDVDKTGRYLIIDGHRRYLCAKRIGLKELPCIVCDKAYQQKLDRFRYEIQNNRRAWRPSERASALASIKRKGHFASIEELAKAVHLPMETVGNSLILLEQNGRYLALWERNNLNATFQYQLTQLLPKIRRAGNLEVDEIIPIIIKKINNKVITNSREIRRLGSVFLRFTRVAWIKSRLQNTIIRLTAQLNNQRVWVFIKRTRQWVICPMDNSGSVFVQIMLAQIGVP